MKIKVYYHECLVNPGEIEDSLVFASKEFGIMEYHDKDSRLNFESLKDMIKNSYVPHEKAQEVFQHYGKLTYLGEL